MKKRILGLGALAVSIISCVVLAGCGGTDTSESLRVSEEYTSEIASYVENGEYDTALETLDELRLYTSDQTDLRYSPKIWNCIEEGKYDKALKYINKAEDDNLPLLWVAQYKELCYEGKELYDEAAQVCIDYYESDAAVYGAEGKNITSTDIKVSEETIDTTMYFTIYRKMVELKDKVSDDMKTSLEGYIADADNTIARYDKITEYMESENYDEALVLIDEALDDGATYYDYYKNKADIYLYKGDSEAAMTALEDYISYWTSVPLIKASSGILVNLENAINKIQEIQGQ